MDDMLRTMSPVRQCALSHWIRFASTLGLVILARELLVERLECVASYPYEHMDSSVSIALMKKMEVKALRLGQGSETVPCHQTGSEFSRWCEDAIIFMFTVWAHNLFSG